MWQFHKVECESHKKARDLFRSAAVLNPQLVDAHIWLARASGGIVLWGWSDEPGAVCQEGLTAAFTAIRLDEKSPYAHYGLAIMSCAAGEFRQATRAAMRAIDLSPGFALGHLVLGMAKLYAGAADQAKLSLQHGLHLNSSDPHNFVWLDLLAFAHLVTGDTDQAIEAATEALHLRPGWHVTLETMAICCAGSGRAAEARRYLEGTQKDCSFPGDPMGPLRAHNPTWRSEIERLLQIARDGAPP